MLPAIIETQHADLVALCRKSFVHKLDLFGSAAHGGFDPLTSDLDFLVEFDALEPKAYAHAYFQLKEGLETLFRRDIDLVAESSVINPYFRAELSATRINVYAA